MWRKAVVCAPGTPWVTLPLLDRASLLRDIGEPHGAAEYLSAAQAIADSTDWAVCNDEQRMALLLLADLTSEHDPSKAESYLVTYSSIRDRLILSTRSFRVDRRPHALEEYAAGCVYRSLGMKSDAKTSFDAAFTIWRDIGYRWRAALALLTSGRMEYREFHFGTARILLEGYERSHVALRFSHELGICRDAVFNGLGNSLKETLRLVCQGCSNKEIADMREVSPLLVRNHVSELMDAFSIARRSRTVLIAECRKRGISP